MTDAELERLFILDASAGPALPIDAARADAIIDAALAGAGFGPGGGGGSSGGATGTGVAAGTKLAIVGGAIVIAVAIALLIGRSPHHVAPQVAVVIPDAAIPDAAPQGSGTGAAAPPVETVPEEPPTIDMPADRATPVQHDHRSAADLLGEANAKRAEKKWRESDALYEKVVQRAPKSLAAQTALVASASLRLEHLGDPKGAAQRFRRALAIAPTGALAEDARWGIAEAARATHDDKAEAAALDAFLAHHPQSPLAERAKARRAELP